MPNQRRVISEKSGVSSRVRDEERSREHEDNQQAASARLDSTDLNVNLDGLIETLDTDQKLVILNEIILEYLDDLSWRPESPESISSGVAGAGEQPEVQERLIDEQLEEPAVNENLVRLIYPDVSSDPFGLDTFVTESVHSSFKRPKSEPNLRQVAVAINDKTIQQNRPKMPNNKQSNRFQSNNDQENRVGFCFRVSCLFSFFVNHF